MKTIKHFKKLSEIVKDKGILAGLGHDVIETAKKHSRLAWEVFLIYDIFMSSDIEKQPIKIDYGYVEGTIGPDGEYISFAEREANSDTTVISERKSDGSWEKHSYTPVKLPDGSWELKIDLPTVYQLCPKVERA